MKQMDFRSGVFDYQAVREYQKPVSGLPHLTHHYFDIIGYNCRPRRVVSGILVFLHTLTARVRATRWDYLSKSMNYCSLRAVEIEHLMEDQKHHLIGVHEEIGRPVRHTD